MSELGTAVGATPPVEFDRLRPEDAAALAELVTTAVRERSALVGKAIDDSLRHLPALLRGPVKRALGM